MIGARSTGWVLVVLALAACTPAGLPVVGANPNPPPPPPRAEQIPKPPVTEDLLVWQPGQWEWVGTGYVWREGEWVQRDGHGTQWEDGHWASQNGAWTWVPGHWL